MLHVTKKEQFVEWWAKAESKLYHLARRYVRTPESAQDLVQDIALLVLLRSEPFATEEDFSRWAHAKLRWMAIDQFQSKHFRLTETLDEVTEDLLPAPQGQGITVRRVLQLVEKLPEQQQKVLKMTLEGKLTGEIADALGIKEATVRSLHRFAKKSLTMILEEEVLI